VLPPADVMMIDKMIKLCTDTNAVAKGPKYILVKEKGL
jgi:hypothetical protein